MADARLAWLQWRERCAHRRLIRLERLGCAAWERREALRVEIRDLRLRRKVVPFRRWRR